MPQHHSRFLISILALLTVSLTSCLMPAADDQDLNNLVEEGIAATLTREAFLNSVDSARETEAILTLPTATPAPTETKIPTQTPTLSPTPEPVHQLIPGSPSTVHTYISDIVSVDSAKDKTATGDSYAWSRLERPFTQGTMIYRNYLDIYQVNMQVTDPWIYITIILIGNLPAEGDVRYSVELDIDHDGRGDFLVTTSLPLDGKWSTDAVTVLADGNDDIGGVFPLYMEGPLPERDGYEFIIFDRGQGEDRDLAWTRRDPDHRNRIQFAFKDSLVGAIGFLWNAWTDEGLLDPGLYDINDQFTFEEAGSPNKGNYRYPLKAVALIDSTCRSWYGYIPSGNEPGLCFSGDHLRELPGYGWCEASAKSPGCENNPCLVSCPRNRFCVPCKLP